MCGRFFCHTPRQELAAAFGAQTKLADMRGATHEPDDDWEPSVNFAPSQKILAVRFNPKTGQRSLDALKWGLVPYFSRDASGAFKRINARAETLDVLPSYRSAFEKRRCLIVANGFFEWQKLGKKRVPYAFARVDRKPFAMAGVWENFRDPANDTWLRTCSIVTCEAAPLVAEVHDRMPVILEPESYGAWLGEQPASSRELKALLRPHAELERFPVSPALNRPAAQAQVDLSLLEAVPEPASEP